MSLDRTLQALDDVSTDLALARTQGTSGIPRSHASIAAAQHHVDQAIAALVTGRPDPLDMLVREGERP